MLQGVVFDLGSTLIRFDGDWPQMLDQSLTHLAQALDEEGYRFDRAAFVQAYREGMNRIQQAREADQIERTTTNLLQACLEDFDLPALGAEALDRVLLKLYSISEAHWKPMPGHKQVLQELKDDGYRIGLISNAGDSGNVQRLIDKVEIRDYLDPILISAKEGIRKPDVRIFQKLLENWRMPPERAVMVGDTLRADVLGAKNVGMRSIWLTQAAESPENRADAGSIVPEATAVKLTEVPTLIRRLNGKVRIA